MRGFLFFVSLTFAASTAAAREVVARPGDTVFSIATRELGDRARWREVARLNSVREPLRPLRPGRKVLLPDPPPMPVPPSVTPEPAQEVPPAPVETETPIVRATIADELPPGSAPIWPEHLRPRMAPAPAGGERVPISDAVALGLALAPEIRSALAEVERVRGEVGVANSGALPQVTMTGEARRTETWRSISALGLDEATFGGTLQVSQALYTFGRLSHAVASATAEEAAALAGFAEARLGLRAQIERAFLDDLLARARLDVAREFLENAQALLHRARAREEAGAGTRFDVSRASADRAAALAGIVEAQAAVETSREVLATAMGLPPGTRILPDGDLLLGVEDPLPVPPEDAERIALAERPDLAVLAHRIDAARERTEYERALGRPTLEATGAASYTRHEYITASSFFRGQDASSGYAGISLSVPIFDGHRVRASVRSQEAIRARIEAEAERARLEARKEVRRIYFDLAAARGMIAARRESVRAAREARRMAEASFDAGRATALDVIQASFVLSQARSAEAEAVHAYRLGLSRLVRATGSEAVRAGG